jgi:hypothetical protein
MNNKKEVTKEYLDGQRPKQVAEHLNEQKLCKKKDSDM